MYRVYPDSEFNKTKDEKPANFRISKYKKLLIYGEKCDFTKGMHSYASKVNLNCNSSKKARFNENPRLL